MSGIIDRYVLLEVLKAFVAILGILILIIVSMLFLRILEQINVGALSADLLGRALGFQIMRDLSSLLPPAFFLSVLVALGRMARDSELIALNACGIGSGRIYRTLLYLAIPVALLSSWFSFDLRPWAGAEIQKMRAHQKAQSYQIAGIQQGRFYQHQRGDITLYIEEIEDKKRLRNIFIQDRREGKMRVVVSDTGLRRFDETTGDQFVTLLDGRRYDGFPGRADYAVGEFEKYNVRIAQADLTDFRSRKKSTVATAELLGSEDLEDRAELENRLASPLAIFTLAIMAVPLSMSSPRQRAYGRMFLAFLAYFCFFNLQRVAENWFETAATPSWMGSLWYQALVLLAVYAVLLPESYWVKRLKARVFSRRTE